MAVTGSISGHTYFDDNANSVQDKGEGDLFQGFPVDLYSADGKVFYGSSAMDGSGNYSFGKLADGAYALRFHTANGFRGDQGSITGEGFNWVTGITVSNGAAVTVNQGFFNGNGGTIAGVVGIDGNGNRQIDGGEGLGGVIVQAHDASGNLVGSTTTGRDGGWSFSGLAGTYTVQVVDPLGQVVSGSAAKTATTAVGTASNGTAFFLAAAPSGTAPSGTGSISGHAYFDPNANAVQESGEGPVTNFPLDLYDADGTILYRSVSTDGNGNYSFGNLADGTYAIRYHTSNGYNGDEGITTADGFNWQTVAVRNGAATTLDSGFNQAMAGKINGTVYADTNNNGRADAWDGGLRGGIVTLSDANGHAVQTTKTDGNGFYYFDNLGGGQYSVTLDPGLGNVVAASPATLTRTVVNGTEFRFASFLATGPDKVATSLSGTVYADANGNGVLDPGEAGIAGAHVAVIDGNGFVAATLTTDQTGQYALPNPVAGQNYRVAVSPPSGYAVEKAQGATGLALTAGQALSHVDLGLAAATPATTIAPPTVSKVINVIVRGQSNTEIPTSEGTVEGMRQQVQTLLGFDGVNQRVNLVAVHGDGNYNNTEIGGTSLTADWQHPIGSDWTSTILGRGYLSALSQIPVADRGAPAAILMLHNEWDSDVTTGLTAARWESAMRYEAGLARAVLGLSAGDAPYLYVSPIPFAVGAPQQPLQNQAIAVGQAELSADPSFNAKVVVQQTSDVTMNHDDPNYNGGFHLNTQDQQTVYNRAALGIAQTFAASAMPGSPVSQANGNIANLGPKVTQVSAVAGRPDQLLLTLAFDGASSLQALGGAAASGLGWSVRSDYADTSADANGTAAQIVDANHLLVTFDRSVPANERLFYTWGSLRLAQNNGPGNGNAVYDSNGLPLSVDPHGLAVGDHAAGAPSFSGTVGNLAGPHPFAAMTLTDPNTGATDTLRITVGGTGGTLSGAGLVSTNDGAYTLSGSAAEVTAALHALTFAPASTKPGSITFTLQAISDHYPTAIVNRTTAMINPASGITAALAHDTGTSGTDGLTRDATVTGTTDPGATVTLTDETKHAVGSATADANGRYSITPDGLADGTHTLTATEVYSGANANTASVTLTLDRTASAAPLVALAHDTGASSTDRVTADASLTVTPADQGGSLSYAVDGGAETAAYDPGALRDGAHTVGVTQTDAAGNVSEPGILAFTLDRSTPPSSGPSGPSDTPSTPISSGSSNFTSGLKADAASGTGLATLTGNVLANEGSGLHVVAVQFGNGPAHAVPATGTVQVFDPNGSLTLSADGSYSYRPAGPGHAVYTETVADAAGTLSRTTLTLDVAKAAIPASLSFGFALTEARFDFSRGHDLMTAPDGTVTDLTGVGTIAFTDGTVQQNDGSPLVDDLYYDARNLDVWRAHADPDQHYAQFGWHEGRDPNASFSTKGYLAANPDVAAAGMNPLTHYDQYGWHEGRSPGANFSAEAYLAVNPDVAKAGMDPLAHYLAYGQAEGRAVQPGLTIANGTGHRLYGDFDATDYLAHNPDVAAAAHAQPGSADSFAFRHYLAFGAQEGRDPDAFFSTKGYLAANPSVAATGVNPLLHYEQTGWFEGRAPSASFDGDAYLAANPDVAAAGMDPLHHYLQFGQAEARHIA